VWVADSLHPLGLAGTPSLQRPRDVAAVVERYFQVSIFLLMAVGFATIFATGRLDSLSVLFVSIALVVRGYLLIKNRDFKIPEKVTNYLTLIYVLVFAVDLFLISGTYVTATIHLVLFSMVVKIFSVQRERDYVYLAVLAFLAVLAASVLTVDTLFFASFVVFILLAVNTFVSMEIRRSLKLSKHYGQSPPAPRRERQLAMSLSTNAVMIVVAIVIGSAVLFFMLPRFSAGYLSAFSPHSDVVTGFSDNVNLGAIGRIQQTDQVIMHVQTDQPINFDLKWRGVALTSFNGKTWTNPDNIVDEEDSYAGHYMLRRLESRKLNLASLTGDSRDFRLLRYRIVMEPIGTNVIFLANVPIELSGRFREIGIDDNGSITNADHSRLTESYEAVSQIPEPSLATLRSVSGRYPPGFSPILYNTPPPNLDPRVGELAHQVTAKATTDYDRAADLEQYLRENYAYTLQLPDRTPADPIANFLFVRKRGHCEYFASAMAIMLRTLGIPSRIVNGFRNGEYNDLTGSYIVRARNAHTWVEAYIPAVGWTSFDPTPAEALPVAGSWDRFRLYLDAAQEFWREWVINYDFGHQRELTLSTVTKAQRSAFDLRRWLRARYYLLLKRAQRIDDRVTQNPHRWMFLLVGLAILVVGLWNLRWIVRTLHRRAIAKRPSRAPQQAATIWYSKMLKRVARQGYTKTPTQTPGEFAEAIPEPSLRDSVSRFTDRYERARFGDSGADAEQLPELYEQIASRD
jgi:protein-glutamine gamma-glutamyltransferase